MMPTMGIPPEPDAGLRGASRRKGSFVQSMRAVAWSFFGIRKGSEHDRDMQQLNPVHVIIAGILGALVFIAVLIAIVRAVTGGTP